MPFHSPIRRIQSTQEGFFVRTDAFFLGTLTVQFIISMLKKKRVLSYLNIMTLKKLEILK